MQKSERSDLAGVLNKIFKRTIACSIIFEYAIVLLVEIIIFASKFFIV